VLEPVSAPVSAGGAGPSVRERAPRASPQDMRFSLLGFASWAGAGLALASSYSTSNINIHSRLDMGVGGKHHLVCRVVAVWGEQCGV